MFLNSVRWHDRWGQQRARGAFLLIAQDPDQPTGRPALRAVVRAVELRQLGHFMMGRIKLGGHDLSVSGTYGSDGLPHMLTSYIVDRQIRSFTPEQARALFAKLHPIPQHLQDAFWADGGHNGPGSEAKAMLAWARHYIKSLRQAGR